MQVMLPAIVWVFKNEKKLKKDFKIKQHRIVRNLCIDILFGTKAADILKNIILVQDIFHRLTDFYIYRWIKKKFIKSIAPLVDSAS